MKYSDVLMDWLAEEGYTHCFFVGGGNVMHLLESARTRFECVAVVHEVAAAIGAEYFNEAQKNTNSRAFAMVTAGPGVTNLVTGVAGAWLESRELLVIAGQARTDAMSDGKIRQVGHQEINAVGIMTPITKFAYTAKAPIEHKDIKGLIELSKSGRKGPVFLEFCIDVTGANYQDNAAHAEISYPIEKKPTIDESDISNILELLRNSKRPVFLFGGGLDRELTKARYQDLIAFGVPIATTWNGSDKFPSENDLYVGRPNTYGMRYGNVITQQADLLIAFGTRLGLQQTGFNWQEFLPAGKLIQIDIDESELDKPNPNKYLKIHADANFVLSAILDSKTNLQIQSWREYVASVRKSLPLKDVANIASDNYVEPFDFVLALQKLTCASDQIIPCSSGGAYTTMMQAFELKAGQIMITDKGLASMGYGLSGAIGASLANPNTRTILTEGDGGFAQNFQELGTAQLRKLNLKIFIYSNQGYASIRTMQKSYFNGNYIGCDANTGVGLPDWNKVFDSFGIPNVTLTKNLFNDEKVSELFNSKGVAGFVLPLDPEQSYYPKVMSKVMSDGKMKSNPIHLMAPDLEDDVKTKVFKYIPTELWK